MKCNGTQKINSINKYDSACSPNDLRLYIDLVLTFLHKQ